MRSSLKVIGGIVLFEPSGEGCFAASAAMNAQRYTRLLMTKSSKSNSLSDQILAAYSVALARSSCENIDSATSKDGCDHLNDFVVLKVSISADRLSSTSFRSSERVSLSAY